MIVIADTSPLQYAVEIGVADVLFVLYGRIVVPLAVASEIRHPGAPSLLVAGLRTIWTGSRFDLSKSRTMLDSICLDPGEREAIALAEQSPESLLIIDDGEGRKEARHRGIRITGLLGVFRDAGLRGQLDFEITLRKLMNTDFRLSSEVADLARRQYRDRSLGAAEVT